MSNSINFNNHGDELAKALYEANRLPGVKKILTLREDVNEDIASLRPILFVTGPLDEPETLEKIAISIVKQMNYTPPNGVTGLYCHKMRYKQNEEHKCVLMYPLN